MMALMDHVRKRDLPPEIKCRQVSSHQIAPLLYSLVQYHINLGGIGFDRCSMQPGIKFECPAGIPDIWTSIYESMVRCTRPLCSCIARLPGIKAWEQ